MRIEDDSATSDGVGVHEPRSRSVQPAAEPEDGPTVDRPTAERRSHRQPVESLDDRRGNRLVPAGDGQKGARARLERIQPPCLLEVSYGLGPASCLQIDDRELEVGVPVGRIPAERPAKGLARPLAVAETPRENPGDDVRLAAEDVEPAGMLEPVECGGGIVPPGADGRLDVPCREPGQRIRDRRHEQGGHGRGREHRATAVRARPGRIAPARGQHPREPQQGKGRGGQSRDLPEPVDRAVAEPIRERDEARTCHGSAGRIQPAGSEDRRPRRRRGTRRRGRAPTSPVWARILSSML